MEMTQTNMHNADTTMTMAAPAMATNITASSSSKFHALFARGILLVLPVGFLVRLAVEVGVKVVVVPSAAVV